MTRPYRPSNGSEGAYFIERWCDRCVHDEPHRNNTGDSCAIVANSMAFRVRDPEYPKEWVQEDNGSNARCTAFLAVGDDPELAAARADKRQMVLL